MPTLNERAEMENEQSSRVARLWVGDDGICRIIHVPDAEVTLEDAQETMAAYKKIYNGRKLPLLIDTKTMRSLSREARHYYAGEEAASCASAAAIIVGTPVSKVLGNFYIGLSNPHLPSRLFTSEEEALTWLKGFTK
jgi:hypothetical protein